MTEDIAKYGMRFAYKKAYERTECARTDFENTSGGSHGNRTG